MSCYSILFSHPLTFFCIFPYHPSPFHTPPNLSCFTKCMQMQKRTIIQQNLCQLNFIWSFKKNTQIRPELNLRLWSRLYLGRLVAIEQRIILIVCVRTIIFEITAAQAAEFNSWYKA